MPRVQTSPSGHAARLRAVALVRSEPLIQGTATRWRVNTKTIFNFSAIHGDMDRRERDLIMREFSSWSSRVIITTDLFARNFTHPSLVINYDMPTRANYLFRVGRSGRVGGKRLALNFVTASDVNCLRDIEQFYNTPIEEMPMDVADLL